MVMEARFHLELNQFSFFLPARKAKAKTAKYAKSQKGAIFPGAKGKSKNRKKEQQARFRQKAKFAKKAKIANRASNGRDKSSVKYDPMCYATF